MANLWHAVRGGNLFILLSIGRWRLIIIKANTLSDGAITKIEEIMQFNFIVLRSRFIFYDVIN